MTRHALIILISQSCIGYKSIKSSDVQDSISVIYNSGKNVTAP
jgi:hypothetical protein